MNYIIIPGLKNVKIDDKPFFVKMEYNADWIIQTICKHFERPIEEINKKYRGRETVMLRRYLFFFLHKYTKMNKSEIGRMYGKDHTTIIHSLKALEDLRNVYPDVEREIQIIDEKINS